MKDQGRPDCGDCLDLPFHLAEICISDRRPDQVSRHLSFIEYQFLNLHSGISAEEVDLHLYSPPSSRTSGFLRILYLSSSTAAYLYLHYCLFFYLSLVDFIFGFLRLRSFLETI